MLIFTHRIDREFESFGWTATVTAERMWDTVYWGKQINNYYALIIQIMTFPVETIEMFRSQRKGRPTAFIHVCACGIFKPLLFPRPNGLTRIYFRQLFVSSTSRFQSPMSRTLASITFDLWICARPSLGRPLHSMPREYQMASHRFTGAECRVQGSRTLLFK